MISLGRKRTHISSHFDFFQDMGGAFWDRGAAAENAVCSIRESLVAPYVLTNNLFVVYQQGRIRQD